MKSMSIERAIVPTQSNDEGTNLRMQLEDEHIAKSYQNKVSRKIRGMRKEWEGERKPSLSLISSPDSEEPGLVYHIVKNLTNPPTPGQPIAMINNWNLYLSM
ncbi:hypothetical protein HJC23_013542 [Cyclotella cryptica]|uniref:Uncharacterized protein n=1 Tax=Cyclotella cryptica TaxID=29204 RepID=A0ABD3P5W0_9STRA